MARKKLCYKCRKEIEEGKRLKVNFEIMHGGLGWFCNDCAIDYKEEDYVCEDEVFNVSEYISCNQKNLNQYEYMEKYIYEFSECVGEDISKHPTFVSKTNELLEHKIKDGYISPQLMLDLFKEGIKDLSAFSNINGGLNHQINKIFYNMNAESPLLLSNYRENISYGTFDKNDFEYFLNEPFKWTSKDVEKIYTTNVSSEEVGKTTKVNGDEFSILLPTDNKIMGNKKMAYRMYAHQQTISNRNSREKHRYVVKGKIDMNIDKYCEQLQMVSKTYKRQLNKLIKDGYIKNEIKDGEKYYILPHISEMDMELLYVEVQATTLRKLVNACSDNALKIYVIIKSYTRTKGKCKLSANKFLEMLGMSTTSSNNRQMVYDCLDILTRKNKNGESFVTFEGTETVYMDEGKPLEINTYKA